MLTRRLFWRLYVTYLIVIFLCTLAVGFNAVRCVEPFYRAGKAQELEQRARLIADEVMAAMAEGQGAVDRLCKALGTASGTRLTVIRPNGEVLGESEKDPTDMEPHHTRVEMERALKSKAGRGEAVRPSTTLKTDMMYVAIRLESADGKTLGALRAALPLTELDEAQRSLTRAILVGMVTVAVLASLLALMISRRLSRPLVEMRRGAERIAHGDFSSKLPVEDTEEVGGLAAALNSMADQLGERISTVTRQRRELEAVLSSMTEGLLAVDGQGRIISLNGVAAQMLGIDDAQEVRGRSLTERVRNPSLQDFVARVWSARAPAEDEIRIETAGRRWRLQLYGNLYRDADEREIGVLVMLKDVTHLRHLERMRRDFVANVSHELKTPITAIRGFVETLREGAVRDAEHADHFLDIVARQAERLGAIVDDLLSLSRIEQDAEREELETAEVGVGDVIESAIADCRAAAEQSEISVRSSCPDDLRATMNPQLVEQALCNLLGNAVKYNEPGGEVSVEAECAGRGLVIRVRDNGWGIPAEHLPRVFERFYRVDKARSRKLGGTGLGLAIVKHIAQAHGGRVTVESHPGQGSTFTLHLPKACAGR